MIIQENSNTGALFTQIPKAIAKAKGIKKGDNVEYIIDDDGRIYLEFQRKRNETNNA